MKAKCLKNTLNDLPERLHKYAFTQDSTGILDLTLGREYTVYGIKTSGGMTYYLMHTNEINVKSYWWMPALLFEIVDSNKPQGWVKKSFGRLKRKETYETYSAYYDWRVAEGIEDGNPEALKIFNANL